MEHTTKVCGTCKQDKPTDGFSPDKNGRQGLDNTCKECRRVAAAKRRAADPERARGYLQGWRDANRDRLHAQAKARYDADPERYRAKARNWARAHTDRRAQAWQAYYADPANREQIKARRLERYREDATIVLEYNRMQRARRRGAVGRYTLAQLTARWRYYGGHCYICGAVADTIDHVIPVKRGGTNWPANLRPACRSCNARKRHSDWRKWVTQQPIISAG